MIETLTEKRTKQAKVYKQLAPLDFQQRHLIGSVLSFAEIMLKHDGSDKDLGIVFPWPEGWEKDAKLAKVIWNKAESEAEFVCGPAKD